MAPHSASAVTGPYLLGQELNCEQQVTVCFQEPEPHERKSTRHWLATVGAQVGRTFADYLRPSLGGMGSPLPLPWAPGCV